MSDTSEPNMDAILDKIAKLYALAAKAGTAEEAASASAKAQELMDRYNLDTVALEKRSGVTSGRRENAAVEGGYYAWQRRLWDAVAELYFCRYSAEEYKSTVGRDYSKTDERTGRTYSYGANETRWKVRHRIIGRIVNVKATQHTAIYLMGAINRILRKRLTRSDGTIGAGQMTSAWATSFRDGAISTIVDLIEAERGRQQDARNAEMKKAAELAGGSSASALTLVDVAEAEEAANYDFENGDGSWAARKKMLSDIAEQNRIDDEEYAAWALANPEEAAKKENERREVARKRHDRRVKAVVDKTDWGAWRAGRDAAREISLNPQTEGTKIAGRLTHG